MLRPVLTVLLLANVAYAAYSWGAFEAWGLQSRQVGEPWRLDQQINAQALRVMTEAPSVAVADPAPSTTVASTPTPASSPAPEPQPNPAPNSAPHSAPSPAPVAATPEPVVPAPQPAARAQAPHAAPQLTPALASTPAPTPSTPPARVEPFICLQATGLDDSQAAAVRNALSRNGFLPEHWTMQSAQQGGRWMVYIGPLSDASAVTRRREALRAKGVDVDRAGGRFEPGLSLGRFSTPEGAATQLAALRSQSISDARVIVEREAGPVHTLRLPRVTAALQPKVQALSAALAGKPLRTCPVEGRDTAAAPKKR